MPTVKLVVIGPSGVGKTSLRGQYLSGRFSNGYRATIGADFITKTVPHPSNPAESVTLQIWDTAGQERFSSLSSAFYRGADAVLLMFDVNTRQTMYGLKKWWTEFREKAPFADDSPIEDYCCVVVGNKMDLVRTAQGSENAVTDGEASRFLSELIPPSSWALPTQHEGEEPDEDPLAYSQVTLRPPRDVDAQESRPRPRIRTSLLSPPPPPTQKEPSRSNSIAIAPNRTTPSSSPSPSVKHHLLSKSRSRSSTGFYAGTMTSTHTSLSIYHTPSSSLFDVYQSARGSPELRSSRSSSSSTVSSPRSSIRSRSTTASGSSGSAVTVTPSLFARENATTADTAITTPADDLAPPARGPKLFFTSAKTGEGVADVFEYVARRVVRRWEYEEQMEARTMHFREASVVAASVETIRLGAFMDGLERGKKSLGACCGS